MRRLVYLNADPGVPLLGPKGASVHVREMLRALARRVDGLTALTARLRPRRERDRVAVSGDDLPPCPVIELGASTDATRPLPAAVSARADRILEGLHGRGGVDAIYERYSLWSVAGMRASRRWGIPWILEVNAPLVDESIRHRGLAARDAARSLEVEALRQASHVVVVSREVGAHVVAQGVDPGRVTVLPNGYRDSLFRSDPARRAGGPFTVVFVGSLKPWHGLDVLVDAFAQLCATHDDCRLLIVGDGPLRDELEARARGELPASAFRFVGAVPHERIPDHLARADVAVAPYPAVDGFYFSPLKLVEYCAMGLPVVASRLGQVAELLSDGDSGLLVEPGRPDALADALRRLHEQPELRARLGRGARRAVAGRSWDAVAGRVIDLFETERAAPTAREVGA